MFPTLPLLSVDPASTRIGWAVLGVGDTPDGAGPVYIASGVELIPQVPPEGRVPFVGQAMAKIVAACRPASVLIEIPDFIAKFAKPHIVWFFRAVGVVEYVAHAHGLEIHHINASEERRKERKQEAIQLFQKIVRRPPTLDDESDALYNGWHLLSALLAAEMANDQYIDDEDPHEYADEDS